MVKGPETCFAAISVVISLEIKEGIKFVEERLLGRKVCCKGGGLPIGEPYSISWTRFGNIWVIHVLDRACFQL